MKKLTIKAIEEAYKKVLNEEKNKKPTVIFFKIKK